MAASASSYDRKELLGEGTFGKVYRGVVKSTGREVAIKKLLNARSMALAATRQAVAAAEMGGDGRL